MLRIVRPFHRAVSSVTVWRKSALADSATASVIRSRADENWCSASSPLAVTAFVLVSPSDAAAAFIIAAWASSEPAMSMASSRAASFALTFNIARINIARVTTWPARIPITDSPGPPASPSGATISRSGWPAS